ncbi:hypothetical protein LGT39_10115 [Demequina sp. TTPB684]|uniref:hypothetical protein n=1 Tax=unclassified Demequina TaxID=2620311 RepID=UPI001CF3184A|nr:MULTISPECIES: hypothetical protein [unclassified Demequina]MCB2413197.1 hypothetical protein [Demequina sp. TTPB684]UPU88372.1 hypothetical protein LGT36_000130 [Demequina sp. TMPB413]
MRNAVTFALDENVWIPLPRRGTLTPQAQGQWVEYATAIAARNSGAQGDAVDTLRDHLKTLVEGATDGEQFVFAPVGEPYPTVVDLMTSSDGAKWRRATEERLLDDASGTATVECHDVEHSRLGNARMVMRVNRDSDPLTATVAFWGEADGRGFGLEATTDQLLVAGQIAAAGKALFETFAPRGA